MLDLYSMISNDIKEELLSRREASQLLKISLPTLHRWVKQNLIPSYYIGGRVYFKRQEIIQSLNKANAL